MKHWIEKEKPGNGGKKGDIDILGNKFGKTGENAVLRVLHGIQKMKNYRFLYTWRSWRLSPEQFKQKSQTVSFCEQRTGEGLRRGTV